MLNRVNDIHTLNEFFYFGILHFNFKFFESLFSLPKVLNSDYNIARCYTEKFYIVFSLTFMSFQIKTDSVVLGESIFFVINAVSTDNKIHFFVKQHIIVSRSETICCCAVFTALMIDKYLWHLSTFTFF